MASLDVTTTVVARDDLGRFVSRLNEAAIAATRETAERGAEIARGRAPFRTGRLRSTIGVVTLSATSYGITVGTSYWKAQEYGARPHGIAANVRFFWEREGRPWIPSQNQTINHPGNPGVHFMLAADQYVRRTYMDSLRRHIR